MKKRRKYPDIYLGKESMESNTFVMLAKERQESDRKIIEAVGYMWLVYTVISWIMYVFMTEEYAAKLAALYVAVTLFMTVVGLIPRSKKFALLMLSALAFSIKMILSMPYIILVYGISGVPRHVRRHARHFVKVQRTRKKTL